MNRLLVAVVGRKKFQFDLFRQIFSDEENAQEDSI